MQTYDQWKTASPYDDDEDVVEWTEKLVKEVKRALLDWDTQPGPWREYIDKLIVAVEELNEYIENNV